MMRTVSSAMASCACSVDAPMWCVPITPASEERSATAPMPPDGSPANTSSPARMPRSRTASYSAAWSTTSARAVLMKYEPGRSASSTPRSIRPRVAASAPRGRSARRTPRPPPPATPTCDRHAQRRRARGASATGGSRPPRACRRRAARRATSCPMRPSPTSPSVRPNRPRALLYSALFQRPALRSAALAGMRRSSARMQAEGQLGDGDGVLARAVGHVDAARARPPPRRSCCSPRPRGRRGRAIRSSAAAPTAVLLTTSTLASLVRSRRLERRPFQVGSYSTWQPARRSDIHPALPNVSAMRTLMEDSGQIAGATPR